MAKKSLKKSRRGDGSPGSAVWLTSMDAQTRSRIVRAGAYVAISAALVVGVCVGLSSLEAFVHQNPRYERALTLEWTQLPDWLKLPDNSHILNELTQRADLRTTDRLLDDQLAERVGRALSAQEIGWVEAVDRVVVKPDGVVSVGCRFRRPAAWVLHRGYCYLVDRTGYRLPGKYDPAECRTSRLLLIDGVKRSPPAVGTAWIGDDVGAGLDLVALLDNRPFRHQVARILVSNFNGRRDRQRPHIELATDFQDARVLWGRAPGEEYGMEIKAAQKVALLDALYREWGRIDMKRPYVDITTYLDSIAMPRIDGGDGALRG